MRVTIRVQSRPGNASEHSANVGDIRLSDLRRLFEAELAINELTGLRVHINVDDGVSAEGALRARVLETEADFKKEDDPEAERQARAESADAVRFKQRLDVAEGKL